jgi:flagellar hook assembly protein FlgD
VPGDRAGDPLEVAVFDLSGRRVRTIEKGLAQPGRHGATWDLRTDRGTRVEGGVYFVRYMLGKEIRSQKLVVLN